MTRPEWVPLLATLLACVGLWGWATAKWSNYKGDSDGCEWGCLSMVGLVLLLGLIVGFWGLEVLPF